LVDRVFLADGLRAADFLLGPFLEEVRFLLGGFFLLLGRFLQVGRFLLVFFLRPASGFFEVLFFLLAFFFEGFFLLVARLAVVFFEERVFFLLAFFFEGFFRVEVALALFFAMVFLRDLMVTDLLAPLVFFFLAAALLFGISLASKLD
jgi:hypothetical protein